jgi:hypothetical protein
MGPTSAKCAEDKAAVSTCVLALRVHADGTVTPDSIPFTSVS